MNNNDTNLLHALQRLQMSFYSPYIKRDKHGFIKTKLKFKKKPINWNFMK